MVLYDVVTLKSYVAVSIVTPSAMRLSVMVRVAALKPVPVWAIVHVWVEDSARSVSSAEPVGVLPESTWARME